MPSALCEYICTYLHTYICCPSRVLNTVKMVCECLSKVPSRCTQQHTVNQTFLFHLFVGICFFSLINFFFFWLRWVSIAACRLSLLVASGGLLFVAVRGLLIAVASLVAKHRP